MSLRILNLKDIMKFQTRFLALTLCAGALLCLLIMLESSIFAEENRTQKSEVTGKQTDRIELIGVAEIPGNAIDKSGLNQPLKIQFDNGQEDPQPVSNNMVGGFSAAEYSGNGNTFYFLSDRGPFDGAVEWQCRIQTFDISVDDSASQPKVKVDHVATTCLTDAEGRPLTGLASFYKSDSTHTERLDPEGLRMDAQGNFYVSDEYGPRLIKFSPTGEMAQEFQMPEHLLIDNPGLAKVDENPKNQMGRQTNRGMEGLAITDDHLFGLMQSPLLQDSHRETLDQKPMGLNCRLQQFSRTGEFEKEFLYRLDDAANKLNEILSTGPSQFLVIERDGEAGVEAKFKKLMLISTKTASDISGVDRLPAFDEYPDAEPVKKEVFIDLLDPQWNLVGDKMPEKIESLTFGPDLPDGRRMLIVTSDNDFEAQNATFVYVFAVPRSAFANALQ